MTWFYSKKKDGSCSACGAPVDEGARMWAVRKGYYTCEPCGFLREQSKETGNMGQLEASVVESLKVFPPEVMGTELAQGMLYLAKLLDQNEVNPRDVPTFQKEIRQTLAQLMIMYPAEPEDDATAAAQKRRETQMAKLNKEDWDDEA